MRRLVKRVARALDVEIRRVSVETSEPHRLCALFAYHRVDLVLDVGANLGQYGRQLRQAGYRGRIVSFEPVAEIHRRLQHIAAPDTRWTVAPPMALGDTDGYAVMNVSGNLVSSSLLPMREAHLAAAPQSGYIGQETVRLARLDSVADAYLTPASEVFLKVDTQGFEARVLAGAERLLPRICGLQLELSLTPLYEGETGMRLMLERLEDLGYDLHAVLPGFTDRLTGRMLQADGVFFNRAPRPAAGFVSAAPRTQQRRIAQ